VTEIDGPLLIEITLRTLGICLSGLALSLGLGLPVGIWLGRSRFAGRVALVSMVNAGMGAPPVVVGLLLALLLWRTGPLGDLGLMYTKSGMILAQALIAAPLVIGITLAAVGSLDDDWDLQVRTLGIPRLWRIWLLLREIRMGVLAAVIAALGGILSEVGAVQMIGGNLVGETRVLTTAILQLGNMGLYEQAVGLAAVLFGLTLLLAGVLTGVQQAGHRS